MFRFPLLNKENIEKYVTITGKEKLDKIKAMNQGCILAANHCGNWEIEGAALSLFGYPILAVGMEQSNKGFDKFLRKYRSMVGQKVEYKRGYEIFINGCEKVILSDFFVIKTPALPVYYLLFLGKKH